MNKYIILFSLILITTFSFGQLDSSFFRRTHVDSSDKTLNMDAAYNRPFLGFGKIPISIGGYAEVNWQHMGTDGVSEGHQFQMRRMSLFLASSVSKKIKFLSEIEFEEGGQEINIEFASIDVEFHPLFNFRGGIVINPIGSFNQNHDGPKWEFTERPVASTQMLPATWSNAGFGLYGKNYKDKWMFGYEVYLTGGFDNSIIDNNENKTFLPAAKNNHERFEETFNGIPLLTSKVAVRYGNFGEIGLSYMGGVYNKFIDDGIVIDNKRRCDVFAIDYNTILPKLNTFVTGEFAWIVVEIPSSYIQIYGSKQHGGFIDLVQPVVQRKMLGWESAIINVACRLEYVDWNVGTFNETGFNIGDELWSISPALSFRPTSQTVFRFNYRYVSHKDVLDNLPSKTGGFSFGVSTYF